MSIAEKLTAIAANQQAVFDAGAKSEYDRFWDAYQNKGNNKFYVYAFAGERWNDNTYNPKYTIVPTGNCQMMYIQSGVTDTKVTIDLDRATVTNCTSMFKDAANLKTIQLLKVRDTIPMHDHFSGCSKLENITIEGTIGRIVNMSKCPLSRVSIESVVSALSGTATVDTVNGKELTATFKASAVNAAFTAEEWAALTASKPNWRFVLAA